MPTVRALAYCGDCGAPAYVRRPGGSAYIRHRSGCPSIEQPSSRSRKPRKVQP